MHTRHWTRRDFVTLSTLATMGVVGGASAASKPQQSVRELIVTYDDLIGQPLAELSTPALLIDLDIFEKNLATMRDACSARGRLY